MTQYHKQVIKRSRTFSAVTPTGEVRVTVRVLTIKAPTGLSAIGWSRGGEDITVVVDGVTHKEIGSIIWVRNKDNEPRYAWSLASEQDKWDSHNTLNTHNNTDGLRYMWRSGEAAIINFCLYIKRSLEAGTPIQWTREMV